MKSVYLLLNKTTNYIKVGVTKDINKRKRTLELQSGSELTLIYLSEKINRYSTIELSFKHKFQIYKTQGEWFNINCNDAKNTLMFILENMHRIHSIL